MHYLRTAVTILAVSIILRFLLASGRRAPERRREGALVLRYPGFVAVVGYVAVGFGALIAGVAAFRLVPMTGEEAVPYLVLGFLLLGPPKAGQGDPLVGGRAGHLHLELGAGAALGGDPDPAQHPADGLRRLCRGDEAQG
ncbi:MAG: hypothetical protein JW820_12710 [Spirochaetales bacterium]|nr:hypothetical protein [Spirochaetales bacterium]